MAIKTDCQTTGAIFHTKIHEDTISCEVKLPFKLELTKEQAEILDANMHNAMELVLAPFFIKK